MERTEASGKNQEILWVDGLNVYYGQSQVVFDLSLRVGRGETVALLGRNGAGKTSTLRGIAGVATARARAISLNGASIAEISAFRRVRSGLALVPSGSRAFPNLSVSENLALVRRPSEASGGWTVESAFRMFPRLKPLQDSSAGTLSGGERQMLAVARAMLAAPSLLMLDEPSEGLAPMIVRGIGDRLREMASEGIGILLTEQNHQLALDVAGRIYFIEKGQVAWSGDAEQARGSDVLERYLAV